MGQVGNQRSCRILTLKKTSGEERKKERKKKNIGYRVASNERRLKSNISVLIFRRDLTTNCDPEDEIPPNRVNTTKQLKDLRLLMVQHGIDAYYVPLDEVGRRSWISGFSGSNGDVIITKDRVSFIFLFPLKYWEEFEFKIEE